MDDPVVIAHSSRGVDGKIPGRAAWRALQQALDFGVINSNPYAFKGDGSGFATADNSEIFVWPIDIDKGRVVTRYGRLVQVTTAGLVINAKLKIDAPPDLHMPFMAVRVESPKFVDALFKVLARHDNPKHLRIATAIHWLGKAWRNSERLDWDDRLVMIKTAFEALTGESKTPLAARALRAIFEGTVLTRRESEDADFLWQPTERPNKVYVWTDKTKTRHHVPNVTPLEHWFRSFGDARNTIIHEGRSPRHIYRARRSRYNGPFFFVASRVLREALRVEVAALRGRDWMFSDDERLKRSIIAKIEKKYGTKK